MKSVAGIVLAAAAMLSACGGGSSNTDAASNTNSQTGPTPVTQESQAIAAPQQIQVGSTQFKATAWMQTVNSTLAGHAIPADQQGAYIELQADSDINWTNVKITGLGTVRAGRATIYNQTGVSVGASPSFPRHAYMFLSNQLNQDYLAIRVQVGAADPQWLRLQSANCACTHRILSTTGFAGGTQGPRVQAVFEPQLDHTGFSAILQSMLFVQNGLTTEQDVKTGMTTYGETDLIAQRGGFSLLDAKRYLVHEGYVAAGFKLSDPADFALLLNQYGVGLLTLIPVEGGTEPVWLTAIDDQYVYVASPRFGNVAIRWTAMPSSVTLLAISTPTAPTSTP